MNSEKTTKKVFVGDGGEEAKRNTTPNGVTIQNNFTIPTFMLTYCLYCIGKRDDLQ